MLEGEISQIHSVQWINDLNSRGEAVGWVHNALGYPTAAHWSVEGEQTLLGREHVSAWSNATGINQHGLIVGNGRAPNGPFVPLLWFGAAGGQPIAGIQAGSGVDVNSSGDILFANVFGHFLQKRDGSCARIPLGQNSWASRLSDDRSVIGQRPTGPFRWSESSGPVDLPIPHGALSAQASDISSDGAHVVGAARFYANSPPMGRHAAVIWSSSGQVMLLPRSLMVETFESYAAGVSSSGWVVGTRHGMLPGNPEWREFGTLWANGVSYELEDLIHAGPSAEVLRAMAVSDGGHIAAEARVNGLLRLIRLDPL